MCVGNRSWMPYIIPGATRNNRVNEAEWCNCHTYVHVLRRGGTGSMSLLLHPWLAKVVSSRSRAQLEGLKKPAKPPFCMADEERGMGT